MLQYMLIYYLRYGCRIEINTYIKLHKKLESLLQMELKHVLSYDHVFVAELNFIIICYV